MTNIRDLGLTVSWPKSEAVFFGHSPRDSYLVYDGFKVKISYSMKYLGVYIDKNWAFNTHIKYVTSKISRVSRALCGILPNLRGPVKNKRRLYYTVITSIALYAAPIWSSEVLESEIRLDEWNELRVQWKDHILRPNLPGRRTREAIGPNFEEWLDRRSGFLTFRLTQFMTGHGCFGVYLFRINKEDTPICRYCDMAEDTPEHTLAVCHFWALERGELTAVIGQNLSKERIVEKICASKACWEAFSVFAERVLQRKEKDERRRQQRQPAFDPG
ncbi:uncharacterized protein [Temnothorax nylanderi]|uniref:uncharacterized protein n=1 Tax=Temnothorax nylanderi TaxID=102681 RepID=UPI003A8C79FB